MTLSMAAELAVFGIAAAYTLASIALQRRLADPKKQREIQYTLSALSRELNAMAKSNATQEAMKAKQQELMPLMSKSMMSQFKPMFVILPIFLVLYYWILPSVPAWFPALFGVDGAKSVQSFFFIVVLVMGFAASVAVMVYDRKKAKEEMKEREVAPSASNARNPT